MVYLFLLYQIEIQSSLRTSGKSYIDLWELNPQIDGQFEQTIQTLEDILRTRVLKFGGHWEKHLPLIEFVYNNNYHTFIGIAPYKTLYGRKCRSLVH